MSGCLARPCLPNPYPRKGVEGRLNGQQSRRHELFDLDGTRFRLFQLRKTTAGEDCMNNNAHCAGMQCKVTLILRFTLLP
jgi:hypothetical protein